MFDEIIELYDKELQRYREIYRLLSFFEKQDDIDVEKYNEELQKISLDLELIDKINSRVEQLKEIYILKNNTLDFTSSEIKKIEPVDKYNRFMKLIAEISDEIKNIKRLQDKIIYRLNKQLSIVTNLLNENEYGKKLAETYINPLNHSNVIDVKK